MKKNHILATILMILTSCGQVQRMENLSNCEFKLENFQVLQAGDIDVSQYKSVKDIDMFTAGNLTLALLDENTEIKYKVTVRAKNPSSDPAGLNKMEVLILFRDEIIASGGIPNTVEIPAGEEKDIPLLLTTNVSNIIKTVNKNDLLDMLFPSVESTGSLFAVQVKPSINIGNANYMYPEYITLSSEYILE